MKERPPLRSSRPSSPEAELLGGSTRASPLGTCDVRRCTWTADSPPLGTLFVDGELVGKVTDFSLDVDPWQSVAESEGNDE